MFYFSVQLVKQTPDSDLVLMIGQFWTHVHSETKLVNTVQTGLQPAANTAEIKIWKQSLFLMVSCTETSSEERTVFE